MGPTSAGKSRFALDLFARGGFGGIVNADAFQVYKQVSVGVASPSSSERALAPHYLFSFLDCEPRAFDASRYRELVDDLVANSSLWKNGPPLFVGGSLFYAKSLFFRLASPCGGVLSPVLRPDGISDWEYLKLVDPGRAAKIHPNDTYRVDRALGLYLSSGVLPSSCEPRFDPVASSSVVVWVDLPDADLRAGLRDRVVKMLASGWVEEVEALIGGPFEDFAKLGCALGYDDVYRWVLEGKRDSCREQLVKTLELKTWDYVRRQRKFWRSFKRALEEHASFVKIIDGCSSKQIIVDAISDL